MPSHPLTDADVTHLHRVRIHNSTLALQQRDLCIPKGVLVSTIQSHELFSLGSHELRPVQGGYALVLPAVGEEQWQLRYV